jgi:hypothetical protein
MLATGRHARRISALRQYFGYMKCLADRFQLKIREGKTKRKKPTHF